MRSAPRADPEIVRKKAAYVKGNVDACNVTDNQTSVVRMSSVAGCMLLKEMGIEPLLQMVVRDRNRIALQSDLLGASALGVRNMLCLSGDHQKFGDDPQAKNVFDIDSMQLIHLVKTMRDEGPSRPARSSMGRRSFSSAARSTPSPTRSRSGCPG